MEFASGSVVKNLPASAGGARDTGLIPRLVRFSGGGNDNPLQYSCQETPMNQSDSSLYNLFLFPLLFGGT